MKFRIYRYNPDTDAKPYMQDYDLDLQAGDAMLLDALLLLKQQEPQHVEGFKVSQLIITHMVFSLQPITLVYY